MTHTTARYMHFWRSFDVRTSFIHRLMAAVYGEEPTNVTSMKQFVEVEVHSAMTRESALLARLRQVSGGRDPVKRNANILRQSYGVGDKGPARHHVWYTGENLRPPDGWSATLSFDLDDFGGTNYYLPHWVFRLGGILGYDPCEVFQVTGEDLTETRQLFDVPPRFACVLAGNPHPMRNIIGHALEKIGRVDYFGAAYGRPIRDKRSLMNEYRFMICPENDLYPGYVTEKAMEAWLSGAVPIWWGDDPAGYLNPRALVNLHGNRVCDIVDQVAYLDSDVTAFRSAFEQPFLARRYELSGCIEFLKGRLVQ